MVVGIAPWNASIILGVRAIATPLACGNTVVPEGSENCLRTQQLIIESSACHVDAPTVHDEAQMPFGDVKGTGMGRFGGKAGSVGFTELRWITVQMTPRHW